jgi:hypothetical protein
VELRYFVLVGFEFAFIDQLPLDVEWVAKNVRPSDGVAFVPTVADVPQSVLIEAWTASGTSLATMLYNYPGKPLTPFLYYQTGAELYVSGAMDAQFLSVSDQQASFIKTLGGGEVYSFLRLEEDGLLAIAGYSMDPPHPLLLFDPSTRTFATDRYPDPARSTDFPNSGFRPFTMVPAAAGGIFIGAVNGYGQIGGKLWHWDVNDRRLSSFDPVPGQSPVVLRRLPGQSPNSPGGDLLLGGTSIVGGSGAPIVADSGSLFLWDVATQQTLWQIQFPGETNFVQVVSIVPADAPSPASSSIQLYSVLANPFFEDEPSSLFLLVLSNLSAQLYGPFPVLLPDLTAVNRVGPNNAVSGPDGLTYYLCDAGIFTVSYPHLNLEQLTPTDIRATPRFSALASFATAINEGGGAFLDSCSRLCWFDLNKQMFVSAMLPFSIC